MAVSNKYARRRRNAVLAAIVMALIIVLIVVIIISAATGTKKKPSSVPTPTPTLNGFPFLPTPTPTLDLGTPDGTGDETLVTPTPDASAGIVMYVTGDGVNVREEASATSDKITSLAKGTSVTAYEKNGDFYEVKLSDGKKGFISAKYLSEEDPKLAETTPSAAPTATPDTSKPTKMYVTGDGVNVRKSNSTTSEKVANLVKGKEVTAYTKVGDWTYIQYGTNKYGYISTKYLSDKAPTSATNAPTLTLKPNVTATPAPTGSTLTSFAQLAIEDKVAEALDNSATYKSMINMFVGLTKAGYNYNGESATSFYTYKSVDSNITLYITFTGTETNPQNVKIQTNAPTQNA